MRERINPVFRDNWITLWEKVLAGAGGAVSFSSLPQWVQMMPAGIFPVMDVKADGVLDMYEYRNFWHLVGGYPALDNPTLEHIFHVMTEVSFLSLDRQRALPSDIATGSDFKILPVYVKYIIH